MNTVDVVIVGAGANAIAATIDAVGRGLKVAVVIRSRRARDARRVRQSLHASGTPSTLQVIIFGGAEVVCVDGVNGIEAVLVRDLRTGRLVGVNTSTLLSFEDQTS